MRQVLALLLGLLATRAQGSERLTIISPHRKPIQNEIIPAFQNYFLKKFNRVVDIDWVDQGGTSDNIRFVKTKFSSNKELGSGIDIFWGGGAASFYDLEEEGFLEPVELKAKLKKELLPQVGGAELRSPRGTWHASGLSSFVILYNKRMLGIEGLAEPKTLEDLTQPGFRGLVSVTDPRRSAVSYGTMSFILLSHGWDKGWELLAKLSANVKSFAHSSSDPQRLVLVADVVAGLVVDFYALPLISEYGSDKLGYLAPPDALFLSPEPVSILKGSPNPEVAKLFVEFLLSAKAQKIFALKKGAPEGPTHKTLGLMAINPKVYKYSAPSQIVGMNAFALEKSQIRNINYQAAARIRKVLIDFLGSQLVDSHAELALASKALEEAQIRKNLSPDKLEQARSSLWKPMVSFAELEELAKHWDQQTLRNELLKSWTHEAKQRYLKVAESLKANQFVACTRK